MNRTCSCLALISLLVLLNSCSMFKPKYGCPSDGRNVGAEKLLSEPPKKVKKFKA